MTIKSKCYVGDCIDVLPKRIEPGAADLVIADPPYNIGKDYLAYHDSKKKDEYLAWLMLRVEQIKLALKDTGSFWLFINDGFVSEVDVRIKYLDFYKKSHVIWYYTFGQNTAKNFTPSHTHILYYVRDKKKHTFNKDDPELRHPSARQVKYNDKRANPKGRLPDNTWAIFPELMPEGSYNPEGDTWLASRVCGTYNEREPHSPNQIPVPLMERIIRSSSNPKDLVVDPFCGSGSSGVAAKITGRNFVGCDLSKTCIEQSRRRIKEVQSKK